MKKNIKQKANELARLKYQIAALTEQADGLAREILLELQGGASEIVVERAIFRKRETPKYAYNIPGIVRLLKPRAIANIATIRGGEFNKLLAHEPKLGKFRSWLRDSVSLVMQKIK